MLVDYFRSEIEVSKHAKVDDVHESTIHYMKIDRGSPAIFIRHGRHQWVAKVGRRQQIVENQETLHRLETPFRQQA